MELLPCPFCGKRAQFIYNEYVDDVIRCISCDAQALPDIWNERSTNDKQFIKHFSIDIGQDRFGMFRPMIIFRLNDRFCSVPLKDMMDWFITIWDSQGDQNKKAIEAKRHLDMFFADLIAPYRDYSELMKKEEQ